MRTFATLALLIITGSFPLASCRPADDPDAVKQAGALALPADGDGAGLAATSRPDPEARPSTIYYDLTRFDWYARGEPIQLGDGPYAPRGAPVRAATASMRKAGEYQGVDFYVSEEDADSLRVYVPVFEGFWLPFVREAESPQSP